MQHILLVTLFFLLSLAPLSGQCLNVNPDCTILSDFDCQTNYVGLPAVANPAPDATNGPSNVGVYEDQNDPYDALIITFGGPIDLTTNNVLRFKVYTTVDPQGRLLAKLEGGSSPAVELAAQTITNGAWAEYTFDFSGQATENHTTLTLILNADITRTNGPETYYLDDIRWDDDANTPDPCAGVAPDPQVLNDFECQRNEPFQVCFPVVDNPLVDATNGSGKIGCFTDVGAEFDNIFIQFDAPLDLSTNNQFSLKVNTTVAGNLLVKLEGGTSPSAEFNATLTGSGQWETPVFDFSGQAGTDHTRLVLFFNSGVFPGPNDKYFIDDLVLESSLPVELTGFNAVVAKEDVELHWTTASEIDVAGYTVEHGSGGDHWTAVAELPSAGDSQAERRYATTHQQPGPGRHFYRLVMRDLDGTVAVSDVVTVELTEGGGPLGSVYPNPFAGELVVPFSARVDGSVDLELIDGLGRRVAHRREAVSRGNTLLRLGDLAGLPAGQYLLRVIQDERAHVLPVTHR